MAALFVYFVINSLCLTPIFMVTCKVNELVMYLLNALLYIVDSDDTPARRVVELEDDTCVVVNE